MREEIALRFKVWLPGTYRTLWRRIWISQKATLDDLARCILDAFEFDHDHLYAFFLKGKPWAKDAVACWDPRETDKPMIADKVKLSELKLPSPPRFTFLYDFGDEWHFQVKYEGGDFAFSRRDTWVSGKGEPPKQY